MSARGFAFAAALLAAGCGMVGPDYRRPDAALPAAFEAAAPQAAAVGVPANWWMLYGDATLTGLVVSGLERNADVRLAAARIEEAEAALREAHATLLFPLIEGSAGASRARTSDGTANSFSLGASTSFEIDVWGRLRRAERATRENLLATRYGHDTVALTLAAAIARAYFALRALDSQLAASESLVQAADETLSLARRRSEGGVASELDVYQAASLRTLLAAQAKELARQRAAVAHQLGVLAGRLDVALPARGLESLPVPPMPPAGLPSQLLERRPDVRAAEAQAASATELIGVARGAQFPTLRLTGALGTQSEELDSLFSAGSRFGSLGLGLVGPIIDAGRYRARTAQAEARARQAEAAYVKAAQNAFREVSDAISNVRLAAATEADLASRVEQSRKALRLARLRYEQGYSAYLEVLDAQRSLNDAELAFIRNRQAYLSYSVDLMNALGGGWTEPAR